METDDDRRALNCTQGDRISTECLEITDDFPLALYAILFKALQPLVSK